MNGITGTWTKGDKKASFGYDFWYQPYWDTMVSTEWGTPKVFKRLVGHILMLIMC